MISPEGRVIALKARTPAWGPAPDANPVWPDRASGFNVIQSRAVALRLEWRAGPGPAFIWTELDSFDRMNGKNVDI